MSRTGPQPLLPVASDEARSSSLVAQLRQPVACACGALAECATVGCGRDVHECRCGRWLARWWCCGAIVALAYEERCPECGAARVPERARASLVGTVDE